MLCFFSFSDEIVCKIWWYPAEIDGKVGLIDAWYLDLCVLGCCLMFIDMKMRFIDLLLEMWSCDQCQVEGQRLIPLHQVAAVTPTVVWSACGGCGRLCTLMWLLVVNLVTNCLFKSYLFLGYSKFSSPFLPVYQRDHHCSSFKRNKKDYFCVAPSCGRRFECFDQFWLP